MDFLKNHQKNRLSNMFMLISLFFQLVCAVYFYNSTLIATFEDLQKYISITYSEFGFELSGKGAYFVTATLVSSFLLNGIRRFLCCFFCGWPIFKEHDADSLLRSFVLLIGYGVIMFFSIGFFGEKYSSRSLGLMNAVLIAISTYIVGLLVDFVDDFFSAVYVVRQGNGK